MMSSTLAFTKAFTFCSRMLWRAQQGTHVANWAFERFLRPLVTAIPGLFQLVASHSQKCLDVPAVVSQ